MKVTALTAGPTVPSAWFRAGQLVAPLAGCGVSVNWRPARISKYPPENRLFRPMWLPAAVASRTLDVGATWSAEITWFVRELVSTLVTLERFTRKPRVLDVDDAIWLHRGGQFARRLAGEVDTVIAGNDFLADWFSTFCRSVVIVPTGVDTRRFTPASPESSPERVVIGWTGTASNFRYLDIVEPALRRVLDARPSVIFRVVSDRRPPLRLPPDRVEFVQWSREGEVASLQGMSIGIMPLADTDWERGKCAYKMLLYMACGLPVVVSPVGMNAEVLGQGEVGISARTDADWCEALTALVDDLATRSRMGRAGRSVVEERYGVDRVARVVANTFSRVLTGRDVDP